jgi:hypothetical protein
MGRGLGLGRLLAILAVSWMLGVDPLPFLSGGLNPVGNRGDAAAPSDLGADSPLQTTQREEELVDFVSFILDDLQHDLPPVVGPLIMREFSVSGPLNQSMFPVASLETTNAMA